MHAESVTPVQIKPILDPDLQSIRMDAIAIEGLQTELSTTSNLLADTEAKSQRNDAYASNLENTNISLSKDNTSLKADVVRARAEKSSERTKLLAWLVVLSIVACGLSGAVCFVKPLWGIGLGLGSTITLSLAMYVSEYTMWCAIAGGVLFTAGCVILAYELWSRNRQNQVLRKALPRNQCRDLIARSRET